VDFFTDSYGDLAGNEMFNRSKLVIGRLLKEFIKGTASKSLENQFGIS
jgi:hypothetical protein